MSKDRIVELVRGDAAPQRPFAALENYVSVLRGRLSHNPNVSRSLLVTTPRGYCVNLDPR